jgi:hypothetical protein
MELAAPLANLLGAKFGPTPCLQDTRERPMPNQPVAFIARATAAEVTAKSKQISHSCVWQKWRDFSLSSSL